MRDFFHKAASKVSTIVGLPQTFLFALGVVILWAVAGPAFNYSDTWQLVINTSTTIVTFLMVFLIQNTQNRDAKAVHLKLDELIRSTKTARNVFVDLEKLTDDELDELEKDFRILREAQADTPVMRKLHKSIEEMRAQRRSRNPAVQVLSALKTPVRIPDPRRIGRAAVDKDIIDDMTDITETEQ